MNTWEIKAGGSQILCQPGLYNKFKASLSNRERERKAKEN
jgi:hypothetical protein